MSWTIKLLSFTLIIFVSLFQNCAPASFENNKARFIPQCVNITAENFKPAVKWDWYSGLEKTGANYPAFSQVMASPVVGDINGDGIPEVAFVTFQGGAYTSNGVLRVIGGDDGKTIFSVGQDALAPMANVTPLLIDLEGDGRSEIIYLHYGTQNLIALNYDGSLRWNFLLANSIASCMAGFSATDLDADGKAEILVANQVISENSSRQPIEKFKLAGHTQANHCHSFGASLDPAKPNEMQIVDRGGVWDKNGQKIFDGNNYWLAVADLYPEIAGLEIIASGTGQLKISNGVNGQIIKLIELSQYNSLTCSGSIGGGPPTVGDFDGIESTLEIAVATGKYLTIFNREGIPLASHETQDCSSLITGITSFDFNGDGKPEILYADEEYLRVFELKDGALRVVFETVNPSGTLLEYPIVADIDGNHTAEILVVSNNYAASGFYKDAGEESDGNTALGITGIRAFTSGSGSPWMPTRKLWNQYHYNVSFVTDSLRPVASTPISSSFTSKIFRRNAQLGAFEERCRR